MFVRNLKKLIKNKWTYIALTCGLILSIMSIIIIPMFSRASLDRLLQHTLKNYTIENSTYPLTMYYEFIPELSSITPSFFKDIDKLTQNYTIKYNLPAFAEKKVLQTPTFSAWKSGVIYQKLLN